MTGGVVPGQAVRVALDATPLLGERTGIGHTVAALLDALATHRDLALSAYAITWRGRDRLARWLPTGVAPRTRALPARVVRLLWRHVDAPRIERWTGPVDVVHATNFVAPPSRAPTIVTVHDLACVEYPELCTNDARAYPSLIRRALGRGAIVHVVSDTVGNEVRDAFGLAADRVVRVYPGLMTLPNGDAAAGRRAARRERYVLALGTVEPRKNLAALVRAFDVTATDDLEVGLVIAGPQGWGPHGVDEAIAQARASDRITRLGYVDEQKRADLFAGATAFAYPSLSEGFGHPPLEAMHAGVPVLAAGAGSLPEVLGDAALFADPRDDDAIAGGLARIVGDSGLRAQLVERGHVRASRFRWTTTADELSALYRRVAG